MIKYLTGLFKQSKVSKIPNDEILETELRIKFLTQLLGDYRRRPKYYHNQIDGPIHDAYNQFLIEKTKLEMELIMMYAKNADRE